MGPAAGLPSWTHSLLPSPACPRPQLAAGADATWRDVGPMPVPRVMGDAVILCDGTIGIFNGATKGIAVSHMCTVIHTTSLAGWGCVSRCD